MKLKNINILSLAQAHINLEEKHYKEYLEYHDIKIKKEEIIDLKNLVDLLYDQTTHTGVFNSFYIGYSIPQIGKEFDLLRFGNGYVVNIELKKTSTKEKVEKQLKRNKYYLNSLQKKVYHLTFISETKELYILNSEEKLVKSSIAELDSLLLDQQPVTPDNIDNLFDPSEYLVSPFNSTKKFVNGEYFLTSQQEDIKSQVLKQLGNNHKPNYVSITGSAGTGKTLLAYDIAKTIKELGGKTIIFHCGYLNQGQHKLIGYGWQIVPIKNLKYYNLSDYDVIFIDEAQRIYPNQLEKLVQDIKSTNGKCVFSYDKLQTLSSTEKNRDIDSKIKAISLIKHHNLSEKIRTNKEIATFIKTLFNYNRNLTLSSRDNIEINYFHRLEDARSYLQNLDSKEWEVLRFTPSQYSNEYHEKYTDATKQNSHIVIGQEFDNVAVIIDRFFSYDTNGNLIYSGSTHYDPAKMLFQNITRARKKINIIIIDNAILLSRCMSILNS